MPAATIELDQAPVNREAVKILSKAIGLREAARRMGLNENTVLQWSARDPQGPWKKQEDAKSLATQTPHATAVRNHSVIKPSKAYDNVISEHGNKTKLGLVKAASKAATRFAQKTGDQVIEKAKQLGEITRAASTLHGWEEKQQQTNVMVNLAILGAEPES